MAPKYPTGRSEESSPLASAHDAHAAAVVPANATRRGLLTNPSQTAQAKCFAANCSIHEKYNDASAVIGGDEDDG